MAQQTENLMIPMVGRVITRRSRRELERDGDKKEQTYQDRRMQVFADSYTWAVAVVTTSMHPFSFRPTFVCCTVACLPGCPSAWLSVLPAESCRQRSFLDTRQAAPSLRLGEGTTRGSRSPRDSLLTPTPTPTPRGLLNPLNILSQVQWLSLVCLGVKRLALIIIHVARIPGRGTRWLPSTGEFHPSKIRICSGQTPETWRSCYVT